MVNAMSRRKKKSKKKSTGNVQSAADLNRRGLALARRRSSTLKLMIIETWECRDMVRRPNEPIKARKLKLSPPLNKTNNKI